MRKKIFLATIIFLGILLININQICALEQIFDRTSLKNSEVYLFRTETFSGSTTYIDNMINSDLNYENTQQQASFTISDVEFGSNSQKRGEKITSNILIKNTGTVPLTIYLSSNAASQYEMQFLKNNVFIRAGATVEVPVSIFVPIKQNSGRVNIATITASAIISSKDYKYITQSSNENSISSIVSESIIKNSTAYLTTKSELEINKVKIIVDGDSTTLDDGEDVEVKAGDNVELIVTVKNTFDENIDIEDIDIVIESDSDLDWDEEESIGDLRSGKKEETRFNFVIPKDIDEDDYDVEIIVDGRDENGARHKSTFTFTVEVNREPNEISITEATITPNKISCEGNINLRTTIENTGSNNQNNVALEILNSDLKLEQYFTRMSLKRNDRVTKLVTFNIDSKVKPGEYLIFINTYYNNKISDTRIVSLVVDKCSSNNNITSSFDQKKNETITIIYPEGTSGPIYGKSEMFDSTTYIMLLIVLILILLFLVIFLLFKYVF